MCRFLRARKWDYQAAKDMMFEAEVWRREFKVDEMYESFTFPEADEVDKLYPKYYHKTDKDGRPVYVEQLGHLDLHKLFKITSPERLIQQLVFEYEKCQRERLPVCSAMQGRLVETSCTIMDLKNVGISQFWKVSSYVQQASRIGQYYYPETMGRFYIINAPYIFTTVWAVVKGWLDPVTREKIQILGSHYLGELAKQIPMESIPTTVGGKCQCPAGCSRSDAGPWNTPEGLEIIQKSKQHRELVKKDYLNGIDDNDRTQKQALQSAPTGVEASETNAVAAPGQSASSASTPMVASSTAFLDSNTGLAPPVTMPQPAGPVVPPK